MGKMTNSARIGLILLAMFCIALVLIINMRLFNGNLMLRPKETVLVYETVEKAVAFPKPEFTAVLRPEDSVPVVQCIDLKHYIVVEIELPDKTRGYVLDGKYGLTRGGRQAFCR